MLDIYILNYQVAQKLERQLLYVLEILYVRELLYVIAMLQKYFHDTGCRSNWEFSDYNDLDCFFLWALNKKSRPYKLY